MQRLQHLIFLIVAIFFTTFPRASRASWEVTNDDLSGPDEDFLGDDLFAVGQTNEDAKDDLSRKLEVKGETKDRETAETKVTVDHVAQPQNQKDESISSSDLSKIVVYGDDDDDDDDQVSVDGTIVDCSDSRFVSSIDCLNMSPADANLSKDGFNARQELMGFMEVHRQKRQIDETNNDPNVFDEGSGTGEIYPQTAEIENATYSVESTISFNISVIDKDTKSLLETELSKAFMNVTGVLGVNVTDVAIVDGKLVAKYEVIVSGSKVSGYGSDLQSIKDKLLSTLKNVTAPAYDVIEISGRKPLAPFDPSTFVDTVAEKVANICSAVNPCPKGFDNCTVTGVDGGRCIHLCFIFEMDGECEHGGTCELDANLAPSCSCSDRWTGDRCQDAVKKSNELNNGEIAGTTIGAILVITGLVGCCCWLVVCRRRQNMNMTHFSDDSGGSDRFSNPSSKISTFVIDRPRISTSPINAFNPGNLSSPYSVMSASTIGSRSKTRSTRARPTLYSDA